MYEALIFGMILCMVNCFEIIFDKECCMSHRWPATISHYRVRKKVQSCVVHMHCNSIFEAASH
jgi:hypothetical protein